MKSMFVLLAAFVCIGLLARNFNNTTRLLVLLVAAGVVVYMTFG